MEEADHHQAAYRRHYERRLPCHPWRAESRRLWTLFPSQSVCPCHVEKRIIHSQTARSETYWERLLGSQWLRDSHSSSLDLLARNAGDSDWEFHLARRSPPWGGGTNVDIAGVPRGANRCLIKQQLNIKYTMLKINDFPDILKTMQHVILHAAHMISIKFHRCMVITTPTKFKNIADRRVN